jgi:hypothetical protein
MMCVATCFDVRKYMLTIHRQSTANESEPSRKLRKLLKQIRYGGTSAGGLPVRPLNSQCQQDRITRVQRT